MTAEGGSARAAEMRLSEPEIIEWGRLFGRGIPAGGCVVTLRGELGSGKTTLVRAICAGYGVTDDVTSPTFAIVHRYASPRSPVYHLDLYRLDGPRDLQNIGFDEIVESDSLVLVEWPERAGRAMPPAAADLELAIIDGDATRRHLRMINPRVEGRPWSR